ncbi:MAG TPA: portal protein, partial [Patescibacteria group bacterium]|nr:portal protein [Patescibacteria group bacterium]
LSVIRVINEYRSNRITVDFIPKDGSPKDELAELCDGLFRADEQDSCAEEAYDNSFEEAVGGGFGAFRLRAEYEDEDDDDNDKQRIRIEPIFDADSSVFFDLNAKRQDKSDAKHCFVIESMTPDEFEKEWGEEPISNVPKEVSSVEYDWYTPDLVYIAEYYCVEKRKVRVFEYITIDGQEERYDEEDFENDPGLKNYLKSVGANANGSKIVKRQQVHKYIICGNSILEDCGYLAGKYIPIIPVYGKRWFVDNIERCMGHVRLAKDAQRLKNMQLSKLAEISAMSPTKKPIFTPEQIAGHVLMWSEDSVKNYPYLLVNPITDANGTPMPSGPVSYVEPPDIPQALAAMLVQTDTDIKELLGSQQEGEELMSNVSGRAVELVQNRKDMQSYIYTSNFAKSIRRTGEVWIQMAKELYVEKDRSMKVINKTDEPANIKLMQPMANKEEGGTFVANDLSRAALDVTVTVGPSSVSRRASTVQTLIGMMQMAPNDPETTKVLMGMAILNMEGEGIKDVREYFRNQLVQMGVIEPTEEEAQAMAANQEPSAQDKALEAMAEEATANAEKARVEIIETLADTEKTSAETELTKAKTVETYSKVKDGEVERAVKLSTPQT